MNLVEALDSFAAKRAEMAEAAKGLIGPGLQLFMRENPEVKAFGWTQYTPHFNDGDPCVFGVSGFYASFVDERDEDLYGDGWVEIYGTTEECSRATSKALDGLRKTLSKAEPELQSAFGDGVRVIVTQEGVDVEEYDHD